MTKSFWLCLILLSLGGTIFSQTIRPRVIGSFPKHGDEEIIRNAFVSVMFRSPKTPLDPSTINENTVRMYPIGSSSARLKAFVIMRNDLHNITYEPHTLLAANTAYKFEVTAGVKDNEGVSIQPYSFIFNTGKIAYRKMITMNKDEPFGNKYDAVAVEDSRDEEIEEILKRMDFIAHVASGEFDPRKYSQAPELPHIDLPDSPKRLDENMPLAVSLDEIEARMKGENTIAKVEPPIEKSSPVETPKPQEKKVKAVFNIQALTASLDSEPKESSIALTYLPLVYHLDEQELPVPWNIIEGVMKTLSEEEAAEEALASTGEKSESGDNVYKEMPAGRVEIPKTAIFRNKPLMINFNFPEKTYIVFTLRTYTGEVILTESGYVKSGRSERGVKTLGVPAGIYYSVIQTDEHKLTRKVTILK